MSPAPSSPELPHRQPPAGHVDCLPTHGLPPTSVPPEPEHLAGRGQERASVSRAMQVPPEPGSQASGPACPPGWHQVEGKLSSAQAMWALQEEVLLRLQVRRPAYAAGHKRWRLQVASTHTPGQWGDGEAERAAEEGEVSAARGHRLLSWLKQMVPRHTGPHRADSSGLTRAEHL